MFRTKQSIGPYYQSEEYVSHSNTSQGLINQLYQIVRNITLKQKRRLVEKVSGRNEGRLLDIGCGTGEFLGTMKKAGWGTLGLEPDEGARNMALSQQGVEKYMSLITCLRCRESDYDVITMWHVLEHVHRLHEYLEQIRKIIKDDGTLLIAVPNYHSKDAENYQAEWAAYDVPRHLYHFSATTMEQLLAQHGFKLESLQHMPFDAFYVSMLSEKYRHGKMRLFSAFWQGLKSYTTSRSKPERGSSILYLVKPV